MRKLAGIAAVAALALGATVVMAASPSPSVSPRPAATPAPTAKPSATPTAKPNATPSPSATPSASPTTGSSTTAAANTWTTDVRPIDTTGSVTVHRLASGQGTVTFRLNDMLAETVWSIRLDRGFFEAPSTRTLIAARTGDDIQHFYNDTIRIHLSKAEMSAFLAARKSTGVVVFISDGSRLSVATFPRM